MIEMPSSAEMQEIMNRAHRERAEVFWSGVKRLFSVFRINRKPATRHIYGKAAA